MSWQTVPWAVLPFLQCFISWLLDFVGWLLVVSFCSGCGSCCGSGSGCCSASASASASGSGSDCDIVGLLLVVSFSCW